MLFFAFFSVVNRFSLLLLLLTLSLLLFFSSPLLSLLLSSPSLSLQKYCRTRHNHGEVPWNTSIIHLSLSTSSSSSSSSSLTSADDIVSSSTVSVKVARVFLFEVHRVDESEGDVVLHHPLYVSKDSVALKKSMKPQVERTGAKHTNQYSKKDPNAINNAPFKKGKKRDLLANGGDGESYLDGLSHGLSHGLSADPSDAGMFALQNIQGGGRRKYVRRENGGAGGGGDDGYERQGGGGGGGGGGE